VRLLCSPSRITMSPPAYRATLLYLPPKEFYNMTPWVMVVMLFKCQLSVEYKVS